MYLFTVQCQKLASNNHYLATSISHKHSNNSHSTLAKCRNASTRFIRYRCKQTLYLAILGCLRGLRSFQARLSMALLNDLSPQTTDVEVKPQHLTQWSYYQMSRLYLVTILFYFFFISYSSKRDSDPQKQNEKKKENGVCMNRKPFCCHLVGRFWKRRRIWRNTNLHHMCF